MTLGYVAIHFAPATEECAETVSFGDVHANGIIKTLTIGFSPPKNIDAEELTSRRKSFIYVITRRMSEMMNENFYSVVLVNSDADAFILHHLQYAGFVAVADYAGYRMYVDPTKKIFDHSAFPAGTRLVDEVMVGRPAADILTDYLLTNKVFIR